MSKFMIGDRVRYIGEPENFDDGTVIQVGLKGYHASPSCRVEWDKTGTYECPEVSMYLVESESVEPEPDPVNHPSHYTTDPSNVECITITRHRNFNVGNAIKYLWRNGLKQSGSLDGNAKQIEDLEKAVFYIRDEIQRLKDSK